jgi:muramoyltetrapeptide carboxypeptidase
MVTIASGWSLPSLDGAILLLEGHGMGLGHIDRQLTMLINAGRLDGVRAVAVGRTPTAGHAQASRAATGP